MVTDTPSPARIFALCVAGASGVLVVAFAAMTLYAVRALLVQFLIAVFLAVSLDPVVRWLVRRRVKRPYAVAIVLLAMLAMVAALIWAIAPSLLTQAGNLASDFPGYLDRLRERSPTLQRIETRLGMQPRIDAWVREMPGRMGAQAVGFAQQFFGAVLSLLVVMVLTVYLMLDLPRLRRGLVRLFPMRQRVQVTDVVNLVIDKVGSYMIGNLLISAIAGVTAFVALTALQVPLALPLALLVAVTDLIPLIGATLGAVVCLVVSAATGELWPSTVLLGLFFLVYQQLENYIIAPRVLRNTVDISSIAVLLTALVGATILGLVGALMAIPLAAAGKVILADRLRARDEATREEATREEATREVESGADGRRTLDEVDVSS